MTLAKVKRIVVSLVGFTVLLIGVILIVFPGPAFIVIPVGLAILATEYVWAKNLLYKIKNGIRKTSTNRDLETKSYYCPEHKKQLVLREAKHGINAGRKFWGCPTWSKTACNYSIPYKTPEPTLKEKLSLKIRNKNGKISPLKIVGQILMIPIYILGFLVASLYEALPNRKKFH
jgi:hypothetical protein